MNAKMLLDSTCDDPNDLKEEELFLAEYFTKREAVELANVIEDFIATTRTQAKANAERLRSKWHTRWCVTINGLSKEKQPGAIYAAISRRCFDVTSFNKDKKSDDVYVHTKHQYSSLNELLDLVDQYC